MKSSSLRSHRKSRAGCQTCKSRKIKCDEQKPACFNCLKHTVRCDFSDTPAPPETSLPSASLSPASPNNALPTRPQPQLLACIPHEDGKMLELELMHNWSTSTCYSLIENPLVRSVWRLSVPKLALSHGFLMDSILALSALHIAHMMPTRRDHLLAYAVQQHNSATQTASAMLANVTEENCASIYLFSLLTYYIAMATPSPNTDEDFLLVSDAGVADWIYLLRGTREIISLSQEVLQNSEFSPMFKAGGRRYELRLIDPTPHEQLAALQDFFNGSVKEQALLDIYISTIEELRKTFSAVGQLATGEGRATITDVIIWIFSITDEYLGLLRNKDNAALVILAYFCVLLRELEIHWWLDGRSTTILRSIWRLVDEEHRLLMRWPIEEMEWLPPFEARRRGDTGSVLKPGQPSHWRNERGIFRPERGFLPD